MGEDDAIEVVDDRADSGEDSVEQSDSAAMQEKQGSSGKTSRSIRLAKLAGIHSLVALTALSAFAAADSWNTVTGLGLAGVLCIITGIVLGITLPTLVHEWFHFLGARFSGARYEIPPKAGLFLYDWDFASNSVRQFFIMSVAGSIGGAVAVVFLWNAVPADTWGRAALRGGAIASFVFAACIEWPVLSRTRSSNEPLTELSKINQQVLSRSFKIASAVGIVSMLVLAP